MTATENPPVEQIEQTKLPSVSVTPEEHAAAVKGLMSTTMKVSFSVTGLPKSKQASSEFIEQIADQAEGEIEGFTVGKRLLSSEHEAIDGLNHVLRKINKWRDQWTFPMVAASEVDEPMTEATAKKTFRKLQKEKGQRLIRIDDVDEFEKGLAEMDEELAQACKKLRDNYDQIIALEKKRLGKQFNQSDYPAREKLYSEDIITDADGKPQPVLSTMVRVGRRQYSEVSASVRLPQNVLNRMTIQAAEQMNQSLEVIIADTAYILQDTFTTLAKQLVDRTQIRPKYGMDAYKKFGDKAEVLRIRTFKDDPANVPEGKILLDVSYTQGRQKITDQWGPITEEEYALLRPEVMDETKRLSKSVISRLNEQLDLYSGLREKLGAYGDNFDKTLDSLRDLIHSAVSGRRDHDQAVVDNIKASGFYRKKLKETLESTSNVLQAVATEAKKMRRSVHSSIAAKMQAQLAK